jgi:hypothetical protein
VIYTFHTRIGGTSQKAIDSKYIDLKMVFFLKKTAISVALAFILSTPALASKEMQYQAELQKWILPAYEGDRDAQFRVGALYSNSQFNQQDFKRAAYWYKQAARQGHVQGQYNLGHKYLTGTGVSPSKSQAMIWWLKAAKQDHALAQFNIGRAYFLGIGVAKDHALSRKWLERAAANNEPKAIGILQKFGWTDAEGALAAADLVDDTDQDVTETATPELGTTALGQTDDTNQIAATESDNVAEIDVASGSVAPTVPIALYTNSADHASAHATQQPEPIATSTPLDGPRLINDNGWLFAQAPEAYTLQLASFDNAQKIAEFESSAKFIKNPELHRFTAMRKDIEWTYFLYGSYSSIELAQAAKIDLNQKLAWIRSFGQLQKNSCAVWKTQSPTHKELSNKCGAR